MAYRDHWKGVRIAMIRRWNELLFPLPQKSGLQRGEKRKDARSFEEKEWTSARKKEEKERGKMEHSVSSVHSSL